MAGHTCCTVRWYSQCFHGHTQILTANMQISPILEHTTGWPTCFSPDGIAAIPSKLFQALIFHAQWIQCHGGQSFPPRRAVNMGTLSPKLALPQSLLTGSQTAQESVPSCPLGGSTALPRILGPNPLPEAVHLWRRAESTLTAMALAGVTGMGIPWDPAFYRCSHQDSGASLTD